MSSPLDKTLAHYLLLERIGEGGIGEVYRARDTRLGRTVALKILRQQLVDDPDRRARFLQEARAAAVLSHPAITVLFEVGEADGRSFLSFEYVPGQTLRAVLADGPMHPKRAVPIAIQVADALAEAHGAGIIHRDVKPANIMITPKGSAKVLDFGLASWTSGGELRLTAAQTDTVTDQVLGTVPYMSPEQALAQPLDSRTDVFSLGTVLYEMLTGRNPFAAPTLAATLVNILKATPEPPSHVNRDVPKELDGVVLRMLARDVQTRYGSAATVASDLRAAFAERTEHVFEDDLPFRQPAKRRRWLPFAAAAVLGAAVAAVGYAERAEVRRAWKRWFAPAPAPLIAVIPLDETGRAQTSFADGLTDDLVMRLGQTPGLKVLGRSGIRAHRRRSPAEVASLTGATVVLTGTVERAHGDLKISLELIDPADGVQVWRRRFVNPAGSVLAAQAVIADEVAGALRVELSPTEFRERSMARSVSPDAYEVYTRGRDALARRDLDGAIHLFDEAVRLDDGLAEAYAGIAEALHVRAVSRGNGFDDPDHARMIQMAVRAAAIEPDLAVVQVARGLSATSYREALRHLARATAADPSSAEVLHQIGDQLIHVDTKRAARIYERSRTLDPRLFANYADLVLAKSVLGRPGEGAREVEALLRIDPGNPEAAHLRSRMAGRADPSAVEALTQPAGRADLPPAAAATLAQRLATLGRTGEALAVLDSALVRVPGLCEAKALRAGLLRTLKRQAEGRAVVAALGDAPPRCLALAAAAFGDAPALARQLRAIGRDEFALRSWMEIRSGSTGETALISGLYPWSEIAGTPEVVEAHQAVMAGFRALKQIADEELRGIP